MHLRSAPAIFGAQSVCRNGAVIAQDTVHFAVATAPGKGNSDRLDAVAFSLSPSPQPFTPSAVRALTFA